MSDISEWEKLKEFFPQVKTNKLPQPLIGVDEVGRGCLAGPVCAGVVILNTEISYSHYQDSKTLSEEKRQSLAEDIQAHHQWALGWASVEEVDQFNIRQATFLAMGRALDSLIEKYKIKQGTLVIDGRDTISARPLFQQLSLIKGDQKLHSISAASIIAKVARDQLMAQMELKYPCYGFAKHKGYGTAVHRAAIEKYKPTPIHRKTFGGVKEFLSC